MKTYKYLLLLVGAVSMNSAVYSMNQTQSEVVTQTPSQADIDKANQIIATLKGIAAKANKAVEDMQESMRRAGTFVQKQIEAPYVSHKNN